MIPIKTYLADYLVGKRFHFKCDCAMRIDVIGTVESWSVYQGEIIWDVFTDKGKYVRIGSNHPNMNIEEL
jgi:hypothetical protein